MWNKLYKKSFIYLILISCLNLFLLSTGFAETQNIELRYDNNGIISFNEPDDIASYEVFYGQTNSDFSNILLSDLSKCPNTQGLFCIAESISRSNGRVFLNLKNNFKDSVFALRYKNINGELSRISNAVDISREIMKVGISAFVDSEYIYFEIESKNGIRIAENNFRIFYKKYDGLNSDPKEFGGCRNFVQLEQTKCVAENVSKIGENLFRVKLKQQFLSDFKFVVGYQDKFASNIRYSNVVYFNDSLNPIRIEAPAIKNLKVNDERELYFEKIDSAVTYFISYTRDYPGYYPKISDMDFCIEEAIESGCVVEQTRTVGSRIYAEVSQDLDAGFFTVYYRDYLGRLSELSRPVYVKKHVQLDFDNSKLIPLVLRQSDFGELSFNQIVDAKRYYLVHTYGDRSGYLYLSDFPGCRYSGLNCAGYNIRNILNQYIVKIRPEKTGNRFAVFYEDFDGNISPLSNSIFIQRDQFMLSNKFTDINFTEYFEAINYLQSNGYVNGYNDGTFRPYNSITRAEFVKIITEAFFPEISLFNPNYSCFNDSNVGDWYNKYLCFAKQKGIISGYSDGSFKPDSYISLAEALKVAFISSGNVAFMGDGINWYSGYLSSALQFGWLPVSSRQRGASDLINRGEMAYITYKILNY